MYTHMYIHTYIYIVLHVCVFDLIGNAHMIIRGYVITFEHTC